MNFKSLAIQVVMNNIESANNSSHAAAALDRLAGGNKAFDLNDFVSKLQRSGGSVARKTKSWLGDGPNKPISATELESVAGADRIAAFALALGIEREYARDNLTQILPELIDKSSQHGMLLDQIGARRSLTGFASRLFRKSA